jgi:hypothetical protein
LLVSTGNTNVAGTLTVLGNYNSLNGNINLSNGSITLGGTVDGRNVSTDGNKLDGIEANATADQTGAEIKSAYESVADTNAFTDAEKTKLSGIEASADVTDTVNVTAAGALMDSEVTNLAQVKAFDSSDYATAAQGSTADSALQNLVEDTSPQLGGQLDGQNNAIVSVSSLATSGNILASTGNITTVTGSIVTTSGNIQATSGNITAGGNIVVGGTVDGVDIATRDAVLTSTTTTANSAMQDLVDDTSPQLGGNLNLNGNDITGTGNISITQSSTSTPALHIYNDDTSDVASPTIRLERKSTMSAADDDSIGKIEFYGFKEGVPPVAPTFEYANITGVLNDVTSNSIDGQIDFNLAKDNTLTTAMSLNSTALELPNGTNLDVAGHVEAREAQIGSGKTGSFDDNYSTGINSSGSSTKVVDIGTGYVNGGTTTINIAPTAPTTTKTINLNAHTNVTGNITVTGTVDGRDVATDGARLDTIPYHRVKHTQLRADNQAYALNTSYNNVGLYDTIVHPATPVECARYLDLDIAIKWYYVSSATNDLFLQLQMTVPTGGGTVTNMGTATQESVNNPEYNGYSNFAWYYVSGDYTHLFTEFGRINTTGTSGSSEGIITAWKYDSVNNRTYLMTYDNPGVSFNTGDTFYYSPYAFESAGATLTVTKEVDERYVSVGAQPHSFKFKTSYDDAALSYTLKMKEYTTADSGQVLGTTVTFTDVEEL